MTWAQDWPWIVGGLVMLAWFIYWEARGLKDGARTHTLSRFVSTVGERFPLSLVIFGMLAGGAAVHFFWHWCPDLGRGVGSLITSAYGQELRDRTVPDPDITPGVASDLTAAQICAKTWHTRDVRSVTAADKRAVFTAYGIACRPLFGKANNLPRCGTWEIDHLVSLELGGANDVRNLWPQAFAGHWNARGKDRLENRLHKEICAGDITLEQAQTEIVKDWRAAYKRRFGEPQ